VLARLRAKPQSPITSGDSAGRPDFPGSGHPDANLLAAFAEKALTEKEWTQVLSHLSQCPDCREVVALTLPVEAIEPGQSPAVIKRRWTPWLFLRWGALAAVLGALTIVVTLHPDLHTGHQEIFRVTPPSAPNGNIANNPSPAAAAPAPQPSAVGAPPQAKAGARAADNEMAAAKGLEIRREEGLEKRAQIAKAKEQVTVMAATSAPATYQAANVPAEGAEQKAAKTEYAFARPASPAPPPAPTPAPASAAATEDSLRAAGEPQAAPAAVGGRTQSVTVAGGSAGESSNQVATAKVAATAPTAPSEAKGHMSALYSPGALRATRKDVSAPSAGRPAALWSVSPEGRVQRSTDDGTTYQQVHVARGIKFRAVAALGNEVWAGGTGGGLFHSADGGTTWTRANLTSEGGAETITAIRLQDPQHITITTASGSQWASEDSGQTWQKQP